MAGVKGKSGRKPDRDVKALHDAWDAVIDEKKLKKLIARMYDRVMDDGDPRAFSALIAHRFGLPTQTIVGDDDAPPVRIEMVRVVDRRSKKKKEEADNRKE